MPRHISILFPGQGSQHIGMLDNLPVELVESFRGLALEALSFDLIDLIKNGNKEDLNKTSITQPAILLTSFIYYKHLQNLTNIKADLMCGHSLGEYTALVASNSITLDDALKLVYQRGLLMERSLKGSMYAILNTDIDIINKFCIKVRDYENMIVSYSTQLCTQLQVQLYTLSTVTHGSAACAPHRRESRVERACPCAKTPICVTVWDVVDRTQGLARSSATHLL